MRSLLRPWLCLCLVAGCGFRATPSDGGVDGAISDDGMVSDGAADLSPPPVSGALGVTYPGEAKRSYGDLQFSDATLTTSWTLLRFQQNQGHTVWSVYVKAGATVGSKPLDSSSVLSSSDVFVYVSEGDPTLPQATQGGWSSATGTATLTVVDLRPTGSVEGSATGTLRNGASGATASFDASWKAAIPR